ncbi:hypothetical protein COU91_01600 [Candidatus Saccharibacteria bacterium CG10_big_fil_rev_8_21_14_0_10_47_8]|nr:MAG: hypothetical protein COU91_01600 [Candidatus Saccharibacteria bacterium CG10_big_fil_rev_8_21_14_0_10_47_8]
MSSFSGSLDANIILRLLVRDVPDQYKASKKLLENAKGQFAVADTALIEVAFVLHRAYGLTKVQVREALEGFMMLSQINCNRIMFEKALEVYILAAGLSLEDCALTAYAQINNALPLYTFDKQLAKHSTNAELLTTI